jgi:acyl-CoA dehydrogenase
MFAIIRRLWIYVGLSISRMYVTIVLRIYAGTNEIMKIVIARGLFKDLLRKGKKF